MKQKLEDLTNKNYTGYTKRNFGIKDAFKKSIIYSLIGVLGVSTALSFKKPEVCSIENKENQAYCETVNNEEKELSTFQEILNYLPEGIVLKITRDDAKRMIENNYLLSWMLTNWNEKREKELENLFDGNIKNGELISLILGKDEDSHYYGVHALFQRPDGTPYELVGIDGARESYFKGMFNLVLFEMINSPTLNEKFFTKKTSESKEYLTLDSKLYDIVKEGLSTKTRMIIDYLKNSNLIDDVKIFSEEKKDDKGNTTTKYFIESKDRFTGKQELKLIEIDKVDYDLLKGIKEVFNNVEKRFSQKEIPISYEENKYIIKEYFESIAEHLTHTISEGGTKNGIKDGDYLSDYPKELRIAQLLGYTDGKFNPKEVLWEGKVKTKTGTLDVKLYNFEFAGGKDIDGLSCEENCKFKNYPAIVFSEYQCPDGKYPAYIMNVVMKSDKKGIFLQVAPFLYDKDKKSKNHEHFEGLKEIYKRGVLENSLNNLVKSYSQEYSGTFEERTYNYNGNPIKYKVFSHS